MNIGVIGLGRMGIAIAQRLKKAKHYVIGYDINEDALRRADELDIITVNSLIELTNQARVFWLMVPSGNAIDNVISNLMPGLHHDDIIIDGGNSNFLNSIKRAESLKEHHVFYLDCGTSGGLAGEEHGFCLMVGGDKQAYDKCETFFKAVAAPKGYALVGPSGAGHYVKMVHNGIEYALLQSYAEGFHVLKDGRYQDLDLEQISGLWMHGSIIRSYILQLAHDVFKEDHEFKSISGEIGGGQTGTWTVQEAHEQNIPVTLIEESLKIREKSHKTGGNYATKLVSLLRNKFGGHEVKKI